MQVPALVRFVVVPLAAAAVMLAGAWFVIGRLGPAHRYGQIALGVVFFVAASVVAGRIGKARGDLRWPLRATVWATVAVVVAGFYWTSLRDTVVNEQVATAAAAPARTAGTAMTPDAPPPRPVNRLLAAGAFDGLDGHGGAATVIDLARLKGTRGDQQYAIPDEVDLGRHDTVLLWCRAFSVRIAGADRRGPRPRLSRA